MRWEDERYCRLYTRDTATWTMLPWQARCLLPLLLRKLDRAGVLDVLEGEEAAALSGLLQVPVEVVEVGLAALIGRRVLVLDGGQLVMPNFMMAQECSQSDKVRQQISREKAATRHKLSQPVTDGHSSSQIVTPSRAVPSRAVPKKTAGEKPPAPLKPVESPRHQEAIDLVWATWLRIKGTKYITVPKGLDFKAIKELLLSLEPAEINAAWTRALEHVGFPTISSVVELQAHIGKFHGAGPPSRPAGKGPIDAATQNHGQTGWYTDGEISP